MTHLVDPASLPHLRARRALLRGGLASALLGLAVRLPGGVAQAHAVMRRAFPPVGGTISASPPEIQLDFSEALEPRFSAIELHDATGARMDTGDTHSGNNDPKRLAVAVKKLSAGSYKVVWHATSVDTHRTEGSYSFTVQA